MTVALKRDWREVTPTNPCPKCGHGSWCSRSADGETILCRRVNDGTATAKTDKSGAEYYLYRNGKASSPPLPEPRCTHANGERGDAATLDKVYAALLDKLALDERHADDLRRRGLKTGLRDAGYRSLPLRGRARLVAQLVEGGLEELLPHVPGFYVKAGDAGKQFWTLAGSPGLLIPIRDTQGRIVALLIRPDEQKPGRKYDYLSTKKLGGAGPGAPVHVPPFSGDKTLVRLTEGGLKANIATLLSGALTLGLPGVSSWQGAAEMLRVIGATTARLAFDADARTNANVAKQLRRLANDLRDRGFAVELEVWDAADAKGIDDLLAAGKTPRVLAGDEAFAEIEAIVAASTAADPLHAPPPDGKENTRPTIVIGTEEMRVNDEAIAALAREPALYQRANMLVHVLRDECKKKGISRPPGSPRIAQLPNARLREMMASCAYWAAVKKGRNGEERVVLAHPPDWSVAGVAARGSWPEIRYLEAVVEAPTLRPDGTILGAPGWDAATGLLYEPRISFPPIPRSPTRDHAQAAAELLFDLVNDFPFVGSEHRVAWLAALLTPVARFAFVGPAPLFLFDANTPGTGKTLLASIIAEIVEGREMARTPYTARDEEMSKVITSIALAGDRLILLDNIDTATPFGCASLDAALTGTTWKQRILGVSQMTPDLPLFTIWFASGNNVSLRGDVHRRIIPCRLESAEERPEQRHGFKYPDLLGYVRANRASLVVAALTILRGYFAAGRPAVDLPPLGSFEGWSNCVRAAIYWATARDPAATREGIGDADETRTTLAAILDGWSELPDGTDDGVTVAEALRNVKDAPDTYRRLHDAFMGWSRDDKLPSPRAIGYRLRQLRGRVVGGRALYGKPDRNGVVRWKVDRLGSA